MELNPLAFYFFAGIAIAFSLFTVFKKNPISSAFSLVVVFFSFAAIYAILGAHLVATLQVLVYAGAILVLFIFVIMLLNVDSVSLDFSRAGKEYRWVSALLCLVLFTVFVRVFKGHQVAVPMGQFNEAAIAGAGGNTRVMAELMFSEYILPFELTSVLLLAGIVGSVAIAKRRVKKP